MRYLIPLLPILLCCTCVRAQIGLHPPKLDFKQLRSEHARIIFPEGYEARARRVAAMIDALQEDHTRSVGEKIYDIDLVLQTATTEINGYVGLAPFRSEFYTTPPQSLNLLGNMDWVDQLTIHEYRHVQQNSNERRGLTKLASYLQGQQGWGVVSFLATPNWYSEGDAVVYETALSPNGRGRTPAFSATLRSLLTNDIIYRYAKARNGSFDELVPDHYRYGYNTLTYARERFGNDVWKPIFQRGAAQGGLLYSFSRALKRQTGYGTKALYRLALEDLQARQDSALAARGPLTEGEPFGQQRKEVTTYRMPFVDSQGRVIALRSGFVNTPELVVVDEQGERDKVLTPVGIQREPYYHLRDNLAVWNENRQNPRYTNEDYSDIFIYDLDTDRKRRLTTKGKYFSPALSFDRQAVVAVEHNPLAGKPAIVVLASNTGEVVHRVEVAATALSFPRFAPDGVTIYFYHRDVTGTALHALNLATGEQTVLRPPSFEPLDYLQVTEAGKLVYSSGRDGVDNVYQLDPQTGQTTRLTNVGIGALFPHLSANGNLYYTEATPRGGRLRWLPGMGSNGQKINLAVAELPTGPSVFERPAAYAAEAFDITDIAVSEDYEVSEFSDKLGGVTLHSWSFNGNYVQPGLTVEATNALNTVRLSADAIYNIEEERPTFGLNVAYGGWLPVVNLSVNTSGRNYSALDFQPDTILRNNFDFEQQQFEVGASLPLRWVAGEFFSALTPGLTANFTRVGEVEDGPTPKDFAGLGAQLRASILQRTARKQVQSRLGASLRMSYDRALGGNAGERFLWRSELFLPGVFPTHGLRLDFDYQRQSARSNYQYVNAFQYARGYGAGFNDRVSRVGVNYQMPLLYPDFGILGITYFQRIRLNAFFDRDALTLEGANLRRPTRRSVGGQLFFDNVWLNSAPITFGAEWAYLLDALPGEEVVNFRILASGGF